MDRRAFLIGCSALAASLSLPVRAGGRAQWLTGFGTRAGGFGMARIDEALTPVRLFETGQRLHKIFPHPKRAEFCAPARRPGTSLFVWRAGEPVLTISAPDGHHYYGHGVYAADGSALYVAENDFENGKGVIGVYDPANDYARVAAFASGGIGPHDVRLHPDGRHLIIANGGLLTHPASGRAVLNLDTMAPSLALIDRHSGATVDEARLNPEQAGLSLRHIDVSPTGEVGIGAQDQHRRNLHDALVYLWQPGSPMRAVEAPPSGWARLRSYIGSVSFDHSGAVLGAATPRGNQALFWDTGTGAALGSHDLTDVCGLAPATALRNFLITAGTGAMAILHADQTGITLEHASSASLSFDNHCQLI